MNENIIVMLALGVWVGVNEVLWAGFRAETEHYST